MSNIDKPMTNRELVDAAIELDGEFYAMQGYSHRPGFKYWQSPHPHERLCFEMVLCGIRNHSRLRCNGRRI